MLQRSLLGLITAATFLAGDIASAAPEVAGGPVAEESTASETVTVTTTSEAAETDAPPEPAEDLSQPVTESTTEVDNVRVVSYPAPPPAPPEAPPVYQPQRRRGLGLMITGWSLFAVSYGLTALSGAAIIDTCSSSDEYDCRKLGGSLMIPVLGPFLATSEVQTMSGRVALVFFPGLVQVAGLSMGIAGTVLFARSRRRYRTAFNSDGVRITRRAPNLRLGNTASPFGGGVRMTYRF